MDPKVTLDRLRGLAVEIQSLVNATAVEDEVDSSEITPKALEMAELFQALDGWIMKGGFLPKGWNRFGR